MIPEQAEIRRELVHSIVLTRIGAGLDPDPVSAVRIADEVEEALHVPLSPNYIAPVAASQLRQLVESLPEPDRTKATNWLNADDDVDAVPSTKAIKELYAQSKLQELHAAAEYLKGEFGLV